jgi:hypothetical protein
VGKGKHIRACRNEHDTTNCKGKRVCRRSKHEATSASGHFGNNANESASAVCKTSQVVMASGEWTAALGATRSNNKCDLQTESWVQPSFLCLVSLYLFVFVAAVWLRARCNSSSFKRAVRLQSEHQQGGHLYAEE